MAASDRDAGDSALAQLTAELRRWSVINRRTPKSFEEFASASGVTLPPPPSGKKYAIGTGAKVILVNR